MSSTRAPPPAGGEEGPGGQEGQVLRRVMGGAGVCRALPSVRSPAHSDLGLSHLGPPTLPLTLRHGRRQCVPFALASIRSSAPHWVRRAPLAPQARWNGPLVPRKPSAVTVQVGWGATSPAVMWVA